MLKAFVRGSTNLGSSWRRPRESARRRRVEGEARGAAYGNALKLATEMIAGVAVGGFIGWALDRLFGSAPLLMVVFLILGAAAGIMNVVRAAKEMQPKAPLPGMAPPDVVDDDDD